MSVECIVGDLLDFKQYNVIVHCVNAQGVMNAGLASSIRDRFPAAFKVYLEAYSTKELTLGTFSVATLENGNKIVNLVGQDGYGTDKRYINYEAFYSGLEMLKNILDEAAKEGRIYSLGFPMGIGCGLAGGNWKIVEAIIRSLWDNSNTKVYIVQKT